MALDRDRVVPGSYEAGEHDGVFLPYKYTAHLLVDGKPFNASAKLKIGLGFSYRAIRNKALLGVEWNMDKNYGRGQVYDGTRPLNPATSLRPVSYKEIPAGHKIAFFAEDRADFFYGTHRFELTVGLRGLMLSNLSGSYALSNRMYFDPRISAQWQLPATGNGLKTSLSGSLGWQTKMPTLRQLHPYRIYKDIIQLNYFDVNPDYRRLNIRTEVIDPVNYDLKPAHNRKWEMKADLSYCGNSLSVTYFREILNSGFRYSAEVRPYRYKKYDATAIDPGSLQGPPDLNEVPWNADTVLGSYSRVTNGSSLWRKG